MPASSWLRTAKISKLPGDLPRGVVRSGRLNGRTSTPLSRNSKEFGVVRVKEDSPPATTNWTLIELRSAQLMSDWPKFGEMARMRRKFRRDVRNGTETGDPRGLLKTMRFRRFSLTKTSMVLKRVRREKPRCRNALASRLLQQAKLDSARDILSNWSWFRKRLSIRRRRRGERFSKLQTLAAR